MTIGEQDVVRAGERLRMTLRYGAFLPEFFLTETGVREALAGEYNLVDVDVTSLAGFRKVVVTIDVTQSQQAGVIGKDVAAKIANHFVTVWGASVERYEVISKTAIGPPSPTTTISLVAIAVIVVAGVLVAVKLGVLK